jgi:hypothetical protein
MSLPATQVVALRTSSLHPKYQRSDELGKEITELCGFIYAATYQLLIMIREFDPVRQLWQSASLRRLRTDL